MITISILGLFRTFINSNYKVHAFSVLSLISSSFISQYILLYELVLFMITIHINCICL